MSGRGTWVLLQQFGCMFLRRSILSSYPYLHILSSWSTFTPWTGKVETVIE